MPEIEFTVNGQKCSVSSRLPLETSLNSYLRYQLSLSGTKAMCREGGCGACIVSVSRTRPDDGGMETFSVNSCLVLVFSCHGWDITTIEGLGSRGEGYDVMQKRFALFNATQCGYCTPGWIMQLHSLRDKHLTMEELERSFGSNTCRCTGYRPILDTIKSFAVNASPDLCLKFDDIEDLKICDKTKQNCQRKCSIKSLDNDWCVIDRKEDGKVIELDFGQKKFFKVFQVDDIFELLGQYSTNMYMLVDGNTAKGTFENFEYPPILIDISNVRELKTYEIDQNVVLGANMSIEDTMKLFKDLANQMIEFDYLAELAKHLELIAHGPVRKIGSLAGNLVTKHANRAFQSDIFLLFEAVGAAIMLQRKSGKNEVISLLKFLDTDIRGVLIKSIALPPLNSNISKFRSYKIMPRHQNALAIVNAAFLIKQNNNTISEIRVVYGNIAPDFSHATKTENFLRGKDVFNNEILQKAINILSLELQPKDMPPEPSAACRKKLAIDLFYKFILNISPPYKVAARYQSGSKMIRRPLSSGTQDYQTNKALYPLNQPVPKYEALIQSSGEAEYVNDIPNLPKQVFGAFVLSTVHNGDVALIDASEAKEEGLIAMFTAKDIPGINSFTKPGIPTETENEEILASKDIQFYGQPIAVIVAETEDLVAKLAKKINVTYKNVRGTPVITIDEAKKENRGYLPGGSDATIVPTTKGDNVKKIIKGTYEIHQQYHYYLEPITCLVVPRDRGLEVFDSTQWMDLTQIAIAQCLDINESQVVVRVRRLGGGFGGKLSRNVQASAACALVARKLDRPCRFILPIQTNLSTVGKRLPCQCDYEVGVDENGKIQYLNAQIVQDDGSSHNENILSYTSEGFKNCYRFDKFSLKTAAILTDLPSNSFARAPGTQEGIASIENIMEHIAFAVQKDPTDVRLANMRVDDNDLPLLIDILKKESTYESRRKDIETFNKSNRWMKKAIQISVMSFPVIYYKNYSAMVSIYRDATVTVTTGGIEMGQGVNTKAAQVCAYELQIPLEHVSVIPSYSFVASNNVFSGSSIVSESVCFAIIKAVDIINRRLTPLKQQMPNATFKELIIQAYDDEIDLTASYMMTDKEPELQAYSAFAVTISEVQLDVLTGRFEILRVDILEDVGLSANPNIDVGQVEGAYVQGVGYYTCEKLVFDQHTGKLLTNRSLNYHVPLALDIPADFRVKLRYNSKNPKGVLGSKAVGEMGICTAHGITHALRRCIMESRNDSGYDPTEWIKIENPYDTESILAALNVKLEELVLS